MADEIVKGRRELYDVAIIGGGPAGSTAARLLHEWGYETLVLARPGDSVHQLAETLPPSTERPLRAVGALDAVIAEAFYRTTGNTSWWGSDQAHVEPYREGDLGYQVLRGRLDALLLALATEAGVAVHHAVVDRADFSDPARVRVDFQELDGSRHQTTCRFVLDCSGRTGIIARRALRRRQRGHATVALVGVWSGSVARSEIDPTHTLAESTCEGWVWSVPVRPGIRYVTCMTDPRVSRAFQRGGIEALYRAQLGKARHLSKAIEGGDLQSVWACDASLYCALQYGGQRFLLVGDAGSFMDPMSSFGVKKAIASAWMAAIATRTILEHPEREELAVDYFSRREHEVYSSYLRRSAQYARRAAQTHASVFWQVRAGVVVEAPEPENEENLREDQGVISAFERIRSSPDPRFAIARELAFREAPCIEDREIVIHRALLMPGATGTLRYLGGIDLVQLVEIVREHAEVAALFAAYNRKSVPVTLPDFLGALSVLVAKGALTMG